MYCFFEKILNLCYLCDMKRFKFLITLVFVIFLNLPVLADVMPRYSGSVSKQAIGFLQVPKSFNLYLYPRYDSQIVESISWTNTEVKYKDSTAEPSRLFTAQVQNRDFAFCTVIDEQEDWYRIIYDREGSKSAWIKPESQDDFWGLKDFYSYYGRRYGLYYMKNIDYRKRGLYSGADSESQKIDGFTLIKSIRLNKLSGNWVLVTVIDLNSRPKIGYIQWRESDGTIILFPKIGQ